MSAKFTKVNYSGRRYGRLYVFRANIRCPSKATLDRYYEEDAPALIESIQKKFAGQLVSFKTELEIVDEYFVQRAYCNTNFLFTYGTLQERAVQLGVFARPLNGFEDELPSYIISDQKIADLYPTLQHTGKAEDST